MQRPSIGLRALAALVLLAAASRADVLVVKATGGGDFTDIAPAVAAAQDGDLILVHPTAPGGSYGPFTIAARSLSVVAAHAGDVITTRVITVQDLAPQQIVLLRGLTVKPKDAPAPGFDLAPGVLLDDCQGPVRLEACTITGSLNPLGGSSPEAAVEARHSADVGFTQCTLLGGPGASSATGDHDASDGGPALDLLDSRAWVHDSQLLGADGGSHFDPDLLHGEHAGVGDGGAGALVDSPSVLTLASCLVAGGDGGVQISGLTKSLGGDGLVQFGPSSALHWRSVTFTGGTGTLAPGKPAVFNGGTQDFFLVAPRHLMADSPVRELQSLVFKVTGQASDSCFGLVSLQPHGGWVPNFKGPVLVAAPVGVGLLQLGTVPGVGPAITTIPLPEFGPGFDFVDVHVQLLVLSDDGATLENGTSLTLLDAAY